MSLHGGTCPCDGCNPKYDPPDEVEVETEDEPRDWYDANGIDTHEDLAAYRLGEE